MTITYPTPASTQEIADFQTAFGTTVIHMMTLRQARASDVSYTLSGYGITVTLEGTTGGLVAKVEAQDPYVGPNAKFADLNADAQGKLLAQAMQAARRQAYGWLCTQVYSGIKLEEVVAQLEALGLPTPGSQTTVTGHIYRDGKQVGVSVRVNGTMTKEEAEEALARVSEEHPHDEFLREAFGDALVAESMPKPVTNVIASSQPTWPSETAIVVTGAE